ncbi:hypothetical protein GCM10010191_07830 [Actinomadura vinacea]|uniref:Uncharacterized protein n=1 Tax=Actinomadura vinacea TaxID=115336 RepID=A0ABN3IEP8_9ACTN
MPRLILLGVGAAGSPRFAPAGLLIEYGHTRVGIDGGAGSEPPETVDAWLVREGGAHADLRRIARETGMCEPAVAPFRHGPLHVDPLPAGAGVYGYRIVSGHRTAVWAPEFTAFPDWAGHADLAFAGTGPDLAATAAAARRLEVRRLVFVLLGGPVLAALDAGTDPPFGEWGEEGGQYRM